MKHNRYIVIVGCGRLGSRLASQLSCNGHSVVVIDCVEKAFAKLSVDFSGFRVEGNATHLAVLKEAKVGQADAFITTTANDNINLMVSQIARKIFDVPKVLARAFDPRREALYTRLGIETVNPIATAAELFLEAVAAPPVAAREAGSP